MNQEVDNALGGAARSISVQIIHRAPISVDHELRWLEPGNHTLPESIGRMLIDHGHAEEMTETAHG